MPDKSKSDAPNPWKVFIASLSSSIGAFAVAVLFFVCLIRLVTGKEVPLRFAMGLGVGFVLIAMGYLLAYKELSPKAGRALLTQLFSIIFLYISGGTVIRFGVVLFGLTPEAFSVSAAEIVLLFFGVALGGLSIWWLRRLKDFGKNYWRERFGILTGKA